MFRWSRRRSACFFWKTCRIVLHYRSYQMFMSRKCGFWFCHCAHFVRIASLHWFSVRIVLFSFHSPRPLRRIGTSMFSRRHSYVVSKCGNYRLHTQLPGEQLWEVYTIYPRRSWRRITCVGFSWGITLPRVL